MKYTFMTESEYRAKYGVLPAGQHYSKANPIFRDPVHFQLKNKSWVVCQGWIDTANEGRVIHSWVEYGGMVLDLHFDYRMNQKLYYKVHKVRGVKKFTPSESRAMMDQFKTYKWLDKI